ncbi:hypothetical protein SAMN05444358_10442 [Ruegeria halocynthiae]|uniref:SPW repeat-containing integral membrane domain-containing protein n=1 Tax=Ruegeria halocynthiae TaxID=985054 RepID=A0A1H3A4N2_9RHOB|nr:hypothetical protein [Ruegeria halocynthiae]SDX24720.1 hypothetical protein SAMN05444358_10442 [Ruegeria halocynthiae]
MSLRFVTRSVHAYLDYPVAIALMVLPFVLGLGQSNPMALWLSVVTGVAAFVLTVLTDHHLGIWRVLPYKFHLAVDLLVGITFLMAPSLFGFSGIDALFYWLNGAAVVVVISLSAPEKGVMV